MCHVCEEPGWLPAELGGCTGHAVLSYTLPKEAAFCPEKKLPFKRKATTRHHIPLHAIPPKKISLKNQGAVTLEGHQSRQRASLVHADAAQLCPAVGRHLAAAAAAEKKAIRIQEN